MKKITLLFAASVLILAMLAGCGKSLAEETTVPAPEPTTVPTTEAATEPAPEETEEDAVYEGDASSYYIDVVYAQQISRYHTALTEQWEEAKYLENGMSGLPAHYYQGNPLENVGFSFEDLDNDGYWELIIGAIMNAEQDPAVFEIWTLVDGSPVMLLQSNAKNHYVLEYVQEDGMWYVVNEASNGAANHGTYYLMLSEGRVEVIQGIVYNAVADENNPWFMTWDLDWDASNDEPIDAEQANAVLESQRKFYTALEYFPYIFY